MSKTPSGHHDLDRQAIQRAAAAFAQLRDGSQLFRECVADTNTIEELIKSIEINHQHRRKKASSRLLATFHRHTAGLRTLSGAINVAVQTQAEFACPLCAPIKFFLVVSDFHATVADQIATMIETITDNLPRFELYKKLQMDPSLQIALLNIFSDIVEFCIVAYGHFSRGSFVQLWKVVMSPLKQNFQDTVDRLKRHAKVVDDTAVAIELVRASQFRIEEARLKCQTWLNPANMNQVYDSRSHMKLEGTCRWFWSHDTVQAWIAEESDASKDRMLCISGKSGCGKSILASSVVGTLRQRAKTTIFFSFSGTDASRVSVDSCVRSLLWQILDGLKNECGMNAIRQLMAHGQPATDELWNALSEIAGQSSDQTYWVIDGIDECCDSMNLLFQNISRLLKRCTSTKAIVLGRPYSFEPVTESSYRVDIDSYLIQADLHSFIATKVDENHSLQRLGARDAVLNTLLEKSEGMFLWAKLMIDELSSASSVREVMHKIHHQPRGLQAAYHRILLQLLQTLDDFEARLVQHLLAFIVAAGRPLTAEELNYAQALVLKADDALNQTALEDYLLLDATQKVRRVCGGLVDLKDGGVSLVHVTAKEFLLRPVEQWADHHSDIISFRLNLNESHQLLGLSCLDHLSLFGTTLRQVDSTESPMSEPTKPFLSYAADFAVYHFNRAGISDADAKMRIRKAIATDGCVRWMEHVLMLTLDDKATRSSPMIVDEVQNLMKDDSLRLEDFDQLAPLANQQLARRQEKFGENDWRTKQLRGALRVMGHEPPRITRSHDLLIETMDSMKGGTSLAGPGNISELLEVLRTRKVVSMQMRVELFLKLSHISDIVGTLTDPLEALFRLIILHVAQMPVVILRMVGNAYMHFQKPRKALEVYQLALEKNRDGEMVARYQLLDLIGRAHCLLHEYKEAEVALGAALEEAQRLLGPRNVDIGWILHWRGRVYYSMGEDHMSAAKEAFQQSISIGRETRRPCCTGVAWSRYWLGHTLHQLGELSEAEKMVRKALSRFKEVYPEDNRNISAALYFLGVILYDLERYTEARQVLEETVAIGKRLHPQGDVDAAMSLQLLGLALYEEDKFIEAETVLKEVVAMSERLQGLEEVILASSMHFLGLSLLEQGKFAEAEAALRQALSIRQKLHPSSEHKVAWIANRLGSALHGLGRYEEAETMLQYAFSIQQRLYPRHNKDLSATAHWLGAVLCDLGRYDDAEKMLEYAASTWVALYGPNHQSTFLAMDRLGYVRFLRNQGGDVIRLPAHPELRV